MQTHTHVYTHVCNVYTHIIYTNNIYVNSFIHTYIYYIYIIYIHKCINTTCSVHVTELVCIWFQGWRLDIRWPIIFFLPCVRLLLLLSDVLSCHSFLLNLSLHKFSTFQVSMPPNVILVQVLRLEVALLLRLYGATLDLSRKHKLTANPVPPYLIIFLSTLSLLQWFPCLIIRGV